MNEYLITRCKPDHAATNSRPARIRVDMHGMLAYVDAQAEQLFGLDAMNLIGKPVTCLTASRIDNPLAAQQDERLQRGETLLLTFRHRDGHFIAALVKLQQRSPGDMALIQTHIQSLAGKPLDIRTLQSVEESLGFGTWQLESSSLHMSWSEGVYRLLDLRPGAEITAEHAIYYFQEGHVRIRAALRRCMRDGTPFSLDVCALSARQRERQLRIQGRPIREGERIIRVQGTLNDISGQHDIEVVSQHWQSLLQGVLQASEDLILALDTKFIILAFNPAFATQFESTFGRQPAIGANLLNLLEEYPNERRLYQRLWERAFERESFSVEMPLAQQEREMPVFELTYHQLSNPQGETIGALHLARDLQSRTRANEPLGYMNTHDPMTGLLNRRELLQRMRRAIEIQRERHTPCCLIYMDLDHFAGMIETSGGSACDRYLRELATLLSSRVRQRDSLARMSTDKFALLLDNCGETEARKVSETISDTIRQFSFEWREHRLQTTVSGGLVPLLGNKPDDHLSDAETVLALAADLCQTAKNAGRDRIHVFHDRTSHLAAEESRRLLRQLEACVRDEEGIELYFQLIRPIHSATWGDHIEILMRLRMDGIGVGVGENTLWQPTSFLPIAERYDLACQLDRKVIHKTLVWLAEHRIMEPRLKFCSFNLSLPSLLDTTLANYIRSLINGTAFPPDCFCFEIREADAIAHPEHMLRLCQELHNMGCLVALDGAGSSTESYTLAARLPVDWIKLDGRRIRSLRNDPIQLVMMEALSKIAEMSGKKTAALFIEDDEILKEVRKMGIHFGQGFRLAPPRPLEELAPVMQENNSAYPRR